MDKIIIAIGGGEMGGPKFDNHKNIIGYHEIETTKIDQEIVKLANKEKPNLLFIPTAAGDSLGYCSSIEKQYGQHFGCSVSNLFLLNDNFDHEKAKSQICSADIIYVGGGNTKFMLDIWAKRGIISLLKEAYERGTILSGLSAGANCWFDCFSSDSFLSDADKQDFNIAKEKLAILNGLGYLKGAFCPHYLFEAYRRPAFLYQIQRLNITAYGVDNNVALVFVNEKLNKVIKSQPLAKAFKIICENGKIIEKEIY